MLVVADCATAQQLDSVAIRSAANYSATHHGASLLVIQSGKTLLEEYPAGGGADTPRKIYSGTKAFWSLAALAAAEDRLLKLDEPVSNTISRWRTDPRKAAITMRQLLNFDSGLEPKFSLHELEAGNRDEIGLRSAVIAQPGNAFIYGPAALQVFDRVLKVK